MLLICFVLISVCVAQSFSWARQTKLLGVSLVLLLAIFIATFWPGLSSHYHYAVSVGTFLLAFGTFTYAATYSLYVKRLAVRLHVYIAGGADDE